MASIIQDAEHWRRRAEEARQLAEKMSDGPARQAIRQLADQYDAIARLLETERRH